MLSYANIVGIIFIFCLMYTKYLFCNNQLTRISLIWLLAYCFRCWQPTRTHCSCFWLFWGNHNGPAATKWNYINKLLWHNQSRSKNTAYTVVYFKTRQLTYRVKENGQLFTGGGLVLKFFLLIFNTTFFLFYQIITSITKNIYCWLGTLVDFIFPTLM